MLGLIMLNISTLPFANSIQDVIAGKSAAWPGKNAARGHAVNIHATGHCFHAVIQCT